MSKVAEAAEDFVEKMTDTEDVEQDGSAEPEGEKSTMDARKAKMEELRRKMVRNHCTKS